MKRKVFITILIVIALIAFIWAFLPQKDSSSIGVIGGADAPTAIFVSTSPNLVPTLLAIGILVVLAIIVRLLLKHRKNR